MTDTAAFSLTVYGSSVEDLKNNLGTAILGLTGTKGKAEAEKPAEEKLAAEAKKATGSTGTVKGAGKGKKPEPEPEPEEEEAEDDGLEDDGLGEEEPEVTQADVRAALLEVKSTFKTDAQAVSKLVGKYGAAKLGDVDPSNYAALLADAQKKLKTAKK